MDLKLHIAKQGGASVKNLQKIFYQLDKSGNSKLDSKEFEKGLAAFGFFPKIVDLQALFKFYDKNGDGQIDFSEFLCAIRDPLNERRTKLVEKAWKKLDSENKGSTTVQNLQYNFSASKNKQVIEKKKSQDDIFDEFLVAFDLDRNNPQVFVSKKDFVNYYTDLGVAIPSDNYFSELVQNTWGIVEDKESTISVDEVRDIIKTLRYKLIQLSKNSQDEYLLRKLFREFDLSKSGFLTLDELHAMMIRLETPINANYLAAVFAFIDKNKSGYIEFEEFVNLVVNNPFP